MESNVVSVGRKGATTVQHGESAPFQPAWMSSSILAIAITAFIAVTALVGGHWLTQAASLSYGWAFVIAGLIIVAEMYGLYAVIGRIRRAYQRKHEEPPVKPLGLAA